MTASLRLIAHIVLRRCGWSLREFVFKVACTITLVALVVWTDVFMTGSSLYD